VNSPLDFKLQSITGDAVDLAQYKGKVVLMVNVASECGLTPQYAGLQKLYDAKKDQGLVVLGFPCNQFGGQEPGSNQEIAQFCSTNYKVSFPLFSKIDVNGSDAAPLYKYLTSIDTQPQGKGRIRWNFEKFLIGRSGQIVARFAPNVEPDAPEVLGAIERELAVK
jgi:glutathione peroxidase